MDLCDRPHGRLAGRARCLSNLLNVSCNVQTHRQCDVYVVDRVAPNHAFGGVAGKGFSVGHEK